MAGTKTQISNHFCGHKTKSRLKIKKLKLLINMYNYEINPASFVEDTEPIRFCPQTDRRTEKR